MMMRPDKGCTHLLASTLTIDVCKRQGSMPVPHSACRSSAGLSRKRWGETCIPHGLPEAGLENAARSEGEAAISDSRCPAEKRDPSAGCCSARIGWARTSCASECKALQQAHTRVGCWWSTAVNVYIGTSRVAKLAPCDMQQQENELL